MTLCLVSHLAGLEQNHTNRTGGPCPFVFIINKLDFLRDDIRKLDPRVTLGM